MPAKTKLIPFPSYLDYSLAPVVDGIKKRQDLGWQEAAWASEEDGSPHGIEIQFSRPQRGGGGARGPAQPDVDWSTGTG